MLKKDLIAQIAKDSGVKKEACENVLNALATTVQATVAAYGEVVIPGVCKISVITKAPRTGRNPRTGEAMQIPERMAVKIKAVTDLNNSVL